jgi:hypothetical protein
MTPQPAAWPSPSGRPFGAQWAFPFSDPQCQTAKQRRVTAAMPTRNSIPAMRFASGSPSRFPKKLASNGREAVLCSPKEGGGAPNGAPRLPRLDAQARPRPVKWAARLSALLRGHAPGLHPTRPGPRFLESPDANGRTLSGTSAASTSQSGTCRTGRSPGRLQAKSDELRRRNRTRSVSRRHRLTSLTMSGMHAVNQIRSAPSKAFRFMQTNRGVAPSDFRSSQARTRFTPFSKIRKSEVVPVNQGFLCFCESLRAARRRANCTAAYRK